MNQVTTKLFDFSNLCYEAAISPGNKLWTKLGTTDSRIPHLLQSVAFRVIFSIVSFLIFPIIISLAIKKGIDSNMEAAPEIAKTQRMGLRDLLPAPFLNTTIQLLAGNKEIADFLKNGENNESEIMNSLFNLIQGLKMPGQLDGNLTHLQETFCNNLYKNGVFKEEIFGNCKSVNQMLQFIAAESKVNLEKLTDNYMESREGNIGLPLEEAPPLTLQHLLNDQKYKDTPPIFLVTIENPSSIFKPDLEIKIEKTTYKLSAVVRKPTLTTEVLFEPSVPGTLKGFTYDNESVTDNNDTSYAAALFYTKVEENKKS